MVSQFVVDHKPNVFILIRTYLGVTWAPGAWIYCGEVFPLKYRAKGVGLAAAGNWA